MDITLRYLGYKRSVSSNQGVAGSSPVRPTKAKKAVPFQRVIDESGCRSTRSTDTLISLFLGQNDNLLMFKKKAPFLLYGFTPEEQVRNSDVCLLVTKGDALSSPLFFPVKYS